MVEFLSILHMYTRLLEMQSSLEQLYAGTGFGDEEGSLEPSLDIVAIHGLNPKGKESHAFDTWQDKKSGNLWLRDRIPQQQPTARIFLYDYNSSPVFGSSQRRFLEEANTFLECLRLERRKDPKRPLLLLGHSLGGILIKQALVNAFNNPRYRDIQEATYGLVFFGTPHGGPGDDWRITFAKASVSIAQSLPGITSNDIMEALKKGSLFSDALQNQWRHQLGRYRIVTFYEGIGTIVPQTSAVIGLPGDREHEVKLQATHSDMCRFNPNARIDRNNFKLVEGNVLDLCEVSALALNTKAERIYEALLDSLRPYCRNPRQYERLDNHTESFQWIWNTEGSEPGFVDWLRSDDRIFWITGKPGSGKSTLMKYLIENKRTKDLTSRPSTPNVLISYFFYELGDPQEKDFVSLLHAFVYRLLEGFHNISNGASSMLIQILEPYLTQAGENLTQAGENPWAQKVLQEALRNIVVQFPVNAQVVLFIDGLDECGGSHADQLDFLKDLVESSKDSKLSVKICIASRADVDIRLRLSIYPSLAIHHFTDPDISSYVTRRLKAAWERMASQPDGTTATFNQELIDSVVRKAEGVFVWVNLVVTQLVMAIEAEYEGRDLHEQVARFPEGLEQLYQRIVAKIPQSRLHEAINLLQIVASTNAHERLSPKFGADTLWKMCNAMKDPSTAISEKAYFEEEYRGNDGPSQREQCAAMKRRVQSSCRGLVHCDDAPNLCEAKVTFLHRTCVEYILNTEVFSRMMAKADPNLIGIPEVSLMAMALRLLKTDPQHKPAFLVASLKQARSGRMHSDIFRIFFLRAQCAERATGSAQTVFVEELDRVCSLLRQEWASLFLVGVIHELQLDWHTDVLCLAVSYCLTLYVSQAIEKEGQKLFHRAGRPLLYYAFDLTWDFPHWLELVQVLLKNGANPNQTFGLSTPWTVFLLHPCAHQLFDLSGKFILLMLSYGANPCQRVTRDDSDWWECYERPEHYTTAFHVALTQIWRLTEAEKMTCIRSSLDHCENYDVVDSDNVGIAEWADTAKYYGPQRAIDPWIGNFIRAEIAARTALKRKPSRDEVAGTKKRKKRRRNRHA